MDMMGQFSQIVAEATMGAVNRVRSGQITTLGELSADIASTTSSLVSAIAPQAATEFASMIEPATQKAIETIKPMLKELLNEQIPTVAAIIGLFTAGAILFGVGIAKERAAKRKYQSRYN